MESLVQFSKDYWVALSVILIIIVSLCFVLRSLVSLLLLFLAVCGFLVFGLNYSPAEVKDIGKKVATGVNTVVQSAIVPILEKELKGAKTTHHEDGTYTIQTTSLTIVGQKGTDQATVRYKDKEYTVNIAELGSTFASYIQPINEA